MFVFTEIVKQTKKTPAKICKKVFLKYIYIYYTYIGQNMQNKIGFFLKTF